MLKKILIICLAYLVIALAFSCHPCRCNSKNYYFNFVDTYSSILSYEFPADAAFTQNETDAMSLSFGTYGINIGMKGELASLYQKQSCFSLINTAMACDCNEDSYSANDPISSMKIYTVNDFDDTHLSGSDVTEYFVQLQKAYNPIRIEKNTVEVMLHKQLFDMGYGMHRAYAIYLDKNPTINNTVVFEVKVTLESGKEFTSTTIPVTLI